MAENITIRKRLAAPVGAETKRPPPAPRHLSKEARAMWRQITDVWAMDPAGEALLRGALEFWDTYQAARAELAAVGLTFTNANTGNISPHPLVKTAKDAFHAFRLTIKQLGLELEDVHG